MSVFAEPGGLRVCLYAAGRRVSAPGGPRDVFRRLFFGVFFGIVFRYCSRGRQCKKKAGTVQTAAKSSCKKRRKPLQSGGVQRGHTLCCDHHSAASPVNDGKSLCDFRSLSRRSSPRKTASRSACGSRPGFPRGLTEGPERPENSPVDCFQRRAGGSPGRGFVGGTGTPRGHCSPREQ